MTRPIVYVVHCVDTEGPLEETLDATFQRLQEDFGVTLEPTHDNLQKIRNKEIDLDGREDVAALTFSAALLDYNTVWPAIDAMLDEITAPDVRGRVPDSDGGSWVYSWHCVDHVGYETNPRNRDLGFHAVFDHYRDLLSRPGGARDHIGFHFHPLPLNKVANANATHYFAHHDILFQVLCRRIIDRTWFPSTNRPGFNVERPDSHWFLEQFIPFDYGNQATDREQSSGRFGDWRRAPRTWRPYHPSHDDYQTPGGCRRWITRCLNVGTRYALLETDDVDAAFAEARTTGTAILAFTNHDHRNMRADVRAVQDMLAAAAARHTDVEFQYANSRTAMRKTLGIDGLPPCDLDVAMDGNTVVVTSDKPTFGPQPFLALKLSDGRYFHDNFDFEEPSRSWTYSFDRETFPVSQIDSVGVATNDEAGNTTVVILNPASGEAVSHTL